MPHALAVRNCIGSGPVYGVLAGTVVMCSRVVTLVFTVTPHILTVSNCTESRPFPVHWLMHGHAPCTKNQKLHRVGTGCGVLAGTVKMHGD